MIASVGVSLGSLAVLYCTRHQPCRSVSHKVTGGSTSVFVCVHKYTCITYKTPGPDRHGSSLLDVKIFYSAIGDDSPKTS